MVNNHNKLIYLQYKMKIGNEDFIFKEEYLNKLTNRYTNYCNRLDIGYTYNDTFNKNADFHYGQKYHHVHKIDLKDKLILDNNNNFDLNNNKKPVVIFRNFGDLNNNLNNKIKIDVDNVLEYHKSNIE
jgi:hypothetical protein